MTAGTSAANRDLAALLREARALLARPDNDFTWSSWRDTEHALAEIDGLLAALAAGERPASAIAFLFVPTGPMQEVSASSGWGDAFVDLADRVDAALAAG